MNAASNSSVKNGFPWARASQGDQSVRNGLLWQSRLNELGGAFHLESLQVHFIRQPLSNQFPQCQFESLLARAVGSTVCAQN